MAVSATIVSAWQDGKYAYVAVRVEGDGPGGFAVEYIGSTPLLDNQGQAKSLQQLKAELVAAVKARRDADKATAQPVAISGQVSL